MIPNMAPHEVLTLWNLNSNPIFNEFFNTEIFHSQSCHFAHIQTGIQTATTSIFRQLILFFDIIPWCWSWLHVVLPLWNLNLKWTTQSILYSKWPNAMTAIHNRTIHCIVDQMVELAIRGSWFTKDNHLKSCIRYANALLSVIIFIGMHTFCNAIAT